MTVPWYSHYVRGVFPYIMIFQLHPITVYPHIPAKSHQYLPIDSHKHPQYIPSYPHCIPIKHPHQTSQKIRDLHCRSSKIQIPYCVSSTWKQFCRSCATPCGSSIPWCEISSGGPVTPRTATFKNNRFPGKIILLKVQTMVSWNMVCLFTPITIVSPGPSLTKLQMGIIVKPHVKSRWVCLWQKIGYTPWLETLRSTRMTQL